MHREGRVAPAETMARTYQRIRDHNDRAIFILLSDEKDAIVEAESVRQKDATNFPLLGIPVAVKR